MKNDGQHFCIFNFFFHKRLIQKDTNLAILRIIKFLFFISQVYNTIYKYNTIITFLSCKSGSDNLEKTTIFSPC